jgi:hypothetical protein
MLNAFVSLVAASVFDGTVLGFSDAAGSDFDLQPASSRPRARST